MALTSHLKTLRSKHAKLEADIQTEHSRPIPDTIKLSELKKEKMRLKEQMQQVQAA